MPVYSNPAGGGQQPQPVGQGQPGQQEIQQQPSVPPLPPTGIQRQVSGTNAAMLAQGPQQQGQGGLPGAQPFGQTSLSQLASRLATSYGLPVGRQGLVDAQGNFTMTPDQVAAESGGQIGMGDAAARMNYIGAAVAREQTRRSEGQARAALESGIKQVQSRGRGSLAAMQSGMYQNLSSLYASEQHEAADFSYFIQQDRFNRMMKEMRKARKAGKKSKRFGAIGSALGGIIGGIAGGPAGAGIGMQLGGAAGGAV